MDIEKISEEMDSVQPKWLKQHDHISTIPFTKSFVFYPYTLEEANEEYLNGIYNTYGYSVFRKPKSESEYNSGQHSTYKVLILEPNYSKQKIDEGCNMIAEYYRDYWSRQKLDLYEK